MVYVEDVTRLPARAQERLLDLLEGGGADLATHRFDVVVVAGAVKHPRQEVQAGRFSADLLARLSAVEFLLPPLRDRREDVLPLASALLHEAAGRAGKYVEGFAPEAEAVLLGSRWPGNVGQLRDVIERACLLADGGLVLERDLLAAMPPVSARALLPMEDEDAGQPLSTVEREHIMRALQRAGGNKKAAARMLGVSRRALYRKLERLDLGTTIARRPRTRPASLHPGPGPDQGHGLTMRALSGLK
jgi:DNA-binding NtrC family response regulator